MRRKDFLNLYKLKGFDVNSASAELDMVLDYLQIDVLKEIKDGGFSEEESKKIEKIIKKRLETQMPLQYITGFGYFMGDKFEVNKNTLIPRPETEILVNECAKLLNSACKVLDIGTGSGCIAVEIAKMTGACVHAVDISENVLKIARENALNMGINCKFFLSDLFSNVTEKYDMIISNPPYIPISEINSLSPVVKNFEPHAALFANDKFGIEFYKKIIEKSVTFLNKEGYLCFEIGLNQSDLILELLKKSGFSNVRVINDLNNIKRVTIAQHLKKNTFQDIL